MSKRRRQSTNHGFLLVDKPAGPTSHDVVQWARRALGTSRVGHTGTLDPFATGLLPLAVGHCTVLVQYLTDGDKEYVATVHLGRETSTGDHTGETLSEAPVDHVTVGGVESALAAFVGPQTQLPPVHSAIKVAGRRLFDYARAGEAVEVPERQVIVYALELIDWNPPHATIRVACGKGYYVRSLARDLGRALEVGGCLSALRRTAVGHLQLDQAVAADALVASSGAPNDTAQPVGWLEAGDALAHLPRVCLDEAAARRMLLGQVVIVPGHEKPWPDATEGLVARAFSERDLFLGLLKWTEAGVRVERGYEPGLRELGH